jgi:hypothetical protein
MIAHNLIVTSSRRFFGRFDIILSATVTVAWLWLLTAPVGIGIVLIFTYIWVRLGCLGFGCKLLIGGVARLLCFLRPSPPFFFMFVLFLYCCPSCWSTFSLTTRDPDSDAYLPKLCIGGSRRRLGNGGQCSCRRLVHVVPVYVAAWCAWMWRRNYPEIHIPKIVYPPFQQAVSVVLHVWYRMVYDKYKNEERKEKNARMRQRDQCYWYNQY